MAGLGTSITDEGDVAKIVLEHELEVDSKICIKKEGVKVALMVREEEISLVLVQLLPTLHRHGNEVHEAREPRPKTRYPVGEVFSVAHEAEECQ